MKHFSLKHFNAVTSFALYVFGAYILFSTSYLHIKTINFPYQLEYREGAVLPTTKIYAENQNPYDVKFHPQFTYNYGFLYPLAVSPLAKHSGITLPAHRSLTYFFIILSSILIFITLLRLKVSFLYSFIAMVILHQSFVYHGLTSLARPEGLGDFLFLTGIILPRWFNFSKMSCLMSIIFGIAGYYTKPYFILVIPFVTIYIFLFISKRYALIYGFISILLFLISAVAVNLFYPAYFNNTLFIHSNASGYVFKYMAEQTYYFLKIYKYLFLIILVAIIVIAQNYKKLIKEIPGIIPHKVRNKKCLNVLGTEPVFKSNHDLYFIFMFSVSVFLFLVFLGGNTGSARGAYLIHLSAPFLIISTFQIAGKIESGIIKILISILLIINLQLQFKPKNTNYDRLHAKYHKTNELIKKSENILNASETVSIMLQHGKEVYNSGHTEYFHQGISKLSDLFDVTPELNRRFEEYKKDVSDKIKNKEFDLILISETVTSYDFLIDRDYLIRNYQCTDTLEGPISKIEAWLPNK